MACVWYHRTGDARFLDRARHSASYLRDVAQPGVRGPVDGRVYTFDTGIFASALLDLFAASGDPSFLREATQRLRRALRRPAAGWVAAAQNADGLVDRWYGGGGAPRLLFRTKVSDATAQALRIWRIMGKHPDNAARAESFLVSVAREDGGLPNYVRVIGPIQIRQKEVCAWPTFFWHHARTIDPGNARPDAARELF